jgi:hypothetical protein
LNEATFEERPAEEAITFKEAAEKQPLGSTARELLLRRALADALEKRDERLISDRSTRDRRRRPELFVLNCYMVRPDRPVFQN